MVRAARGRFQFGPTEVDITTFENLSGLIGDIYDTTLKPSLWPSVLERACLFVQSVGDTMRGRMELIAPHIQRAVLIGRQIRMAEDRIGDHQAILDAYSAAVFLVGEKGQLRFATSARRSEDGHPSRRRRRASRATLEALKPMLLAQSPLAFRKRMIFVEHDPLRRARMPTA